LLRLQGPRVGGLDLHSADVECDVRWQPSVAPDEAALAVLDVNLVGPWRVTAAALPALRASRGRVVNVASGLAHITVPFATSTTRQATLGYALLRLPRRVIDGVTRAQMRRLARRGHFGTDGLAGEYAARLRE
jgi:NAD(P)-dependent dehydrogenase (short-subunit alcohol dehydrogenase family)